MADAAPPTASSPPSMTDQVVIVTGATRGIGRAVAGRAVAAGARVFVVARNPDAVNVTARELGRSAHPFAMDVRREDAVRDLAREVTRLYGRADLLVNNAGIMIRGDVASCPAQDFLDTLHTNLAGPFFFMREFLPLLEKRQGSTIVNVASLAPTAPNPGLGAYAASKAGLVALSDALREEVRAKGVRVAVVLPGSTRTSLHRRELTGDDAWMLDPDDVAAAILSLHAMPAGALVSRLELRPTRKRA